MVKVHPWAGKLCTKGGGSACRGRLPAGGSCT